MTIACTLLYGIRCRNAVTIILFSSSNSNQFISRIKALSINMNDEKIINRLEKKCANAVPIIINEIVKAKMAEKIILHL